MAVESTCLICRKNLALGEIASCQHTDCDREKFSDWRISCGESLCQLLFRSVPLSLYQYFQREKYCADCQQIIRDVDFSVRQIKFLEKRTRKLFSKIKQHLQANYNCIEEKTSQEVLKERITAVLDPVEDEKESLDKYSYDEIVEIVHEAAINREKYSWKTPVTIISEGEIKTDEDEVPLTLFKMELGEEVDESFDEMENEQLETSEKRERQDEIESFSGLEDSFQMYSSPHEYPPNVQPSQRMAKRLKMSLNEMESEEEQVLLKEMDRSEFNLQSEESSNDRDFETEHKSNSLWLKHGRRSSKLTNQQENVVQSKRCVEVKRKRKRKKGSNQTVNLKRPKVKCNICNQQFFRANIADHIRTHTGEKPFSCEICCMSFTGKNRLIKHLEKRHGMVAPDGLKIKMPTVVASVQNEFVSRKRLYHCELCSWTYNMKYRYLRHLKDEHLNKDVKNEDTFCFHYCDAVDCVNSYTSFDSLRKHIFEAHLASDESKWIPECEKCQKSFLHQCNLALHVKCHKKDNSGCKYCNLEISSEKELELHLPRHEIVFSESLFCHVCSECGEGFTSLSMLRRHEAKAHDDSGLVGRKKLQKSARVFCKICQKGIYNKTLTTHILKFHAAEDVNWKSDLETPTQPSKGQERRSRKPELVTLKRIYHCEFCSRTFTMNHRFLRHLKDEHLNKDVKNEDTFYFHYCDAVDCFNSYTSLHSLRTHIFETHLGRDVSKWIPECDKCGKPFLHPSSLKLHAKCHGEDDLGCQYCNSEISSREDLEHHLRAHQIVFSESFFSHVCHQCGEGYSDIGNLRRHIKTVHDFKNREPEVNKKQRVELVFCKICQKEVNKKHTTLEDHMIKYHPKEGVQSKGNALSSHDKSLDSQMTAPVGTDNEICSICHQHFHKSRLKPHMFTHTHPEGFKCPKCTVTKSSPGQLEGHIIRFHPPHQNNMPKRFLGRGGKCDICNKECKPRAIYRKHIVREHPEEYQSTHPHVCQFCWFVFEKEEERNSHVENLHNSYVCSFAGCGKRFTEKARLEAHLNIHNNVKPFLCPYCKRGFSNVGNCYSHVHMVHTKHRSLRCKLCPENPGYYVKKEFTKHVKKSHPEISVDQHKLVLIHQKPLESLKIEKVSATQCT